MGWMKEIDDTGFNSLANICLLILTGFIILHGLADQITKTRASKKCKEAAKYDVGFLTRNRKLQDFPQPYPNTWYFVMGSK
mmetsp:Transcript_1118/g.1423  ORF Transcript_1118/g.1423 Transcript_1118/m.1423 type:complete len:81 (-) Transcript_1118:2614-2856(-)